MKLSNINILGGASASSLPSTFLDRIISLPITALEIFNRTKDKIKDQGTNNGDKYKLIYNHDGINYELKFKTKIDHSFVNDKREMIIIEKTGSSTGFHLTFHSPYEMMDDTKNTNRIHIKNNSRNSARKREFTLTVQQISDIDCFHLTNDFNPSYNFDDQDAIDILDFSNHFFREICQEIKDTEIPDPTLPPEPLEEQNVSTTTLNPEVNEWKPASTQVEVPTSTLRATANEWKPATKTDRIKYSYFSKYQNYKLKYINLKKKLQI